MNQFDHYGEKDIFEESKPMCENDVNEFCKYINAQLSICSDSELFGDLHETHGSKILMLFAELFAFLHKKYGISNTKKMISSFQNSLVFKDWFWTVKHHLGLFVMHDPTFDEIGKWIGMGFFLKISYSTMVYNNILIDNHTVKECIDKQRKFLNYLNTSYHDHHRLASPVHITESGYFLFNEETSLDPIDPTFHTINSIT